MKKWLLALLFTFNAQAAVVATMPNQSGGQMVLTDAVCKASPKLWTMFGYTGNGEILSGCWTAEGNMVVVVWQDGDIRRYPISAFTLPSRGSV